MVKDENDTLTSKESWEQAAIMWKLQGDDSKANACLIIASLFDE